MTENNVYDSMSGMSKDGSVLRLKIYPSVAIVICFIFFGFGVLLSKIVFNNKQEIKYIPQVGPSPTTDPYRILGFKGVLKKIDNNYNLFTNTSDSITIIVPANVDLAAFVNRRIFAVGNYNGLTKTLVIEKASDLELLPAKPALIPTLSPLKISPSVLNPSM